MIECDENGPLSLMITKIWMDPHAGESPSGGSTQARSSRAKRVGARWRQGREGPAGGHDGRRGPHLRPTVTAGNIAAITGIRSAAAGVTVARPGVTPFEAIRHYSEPVVTKAIEPLAMKDLPKFIGAMSSLAKADASLSVSTNSETGEALLAGMGELHLEITRCQVEEEHGIKVKQSDPTPLPRAHPVPERRLPLRGQSPNRHNRFYVETEPLPTEVIQALRRASRRGDRQEQGRQGGRRQVRGLRPQQGPDEEDLRHHGTNVLVNDTKGIQNLHETRSSSSRGSTRSARGPARRGAADGRHGQADRRQAPRGRHPPWPGPDHTSGQERHQGEPRQVEASHTGKPIQNIRIDAPNDVIGGVTREVTNRRRSSRTCRSTGDRLRGIGKMPVGETFGFSNDIRAASQGRAVWNTENAGFDILPMSLFEKTVGDIRERKGSSPRSPVRPTTQTEPTVSSPSGSP